VPTYEYACTDCGERHELVQRFTDPTLTECPSCTGRLRKVFSPVGVVFKGSGFYKTDSRSSSGNGSARSDDGGTAKTDGKTDTKSDAKSETGGSKSDAKASGDSARSGSSTGSGSSGSGSTGSGSSDSGSSGSAKPAKPAAAAS
jgi:putative FmdB family regulatory protein